jgi:hypothetical protein
MRLAWLFMVGAVVVCLIIIIYIAYTVLSGLGYI